MFVVKRQFFIFQSQIQAGLNGGLILVALLEFAFALWSAIRAGISGIDCCDIPRKEKVGYIEK